MSDQAEQMCVFLPCGADRQWAVPQNCLAEILTLPASEDLVPTQVNWRGVDIPVMDLGTSDGPPWRDAGNSTGLVAVILGVRGEGAEYWAVALRGPGLSVQKVDSVDCRDLPAAVDEHCLAAFELDGRIYQVPNLPALQGLALRPDTAAAAQVAS